MARLTEEKIQEIVKEYQVIGTYSGVAKKVGVSPTTVKKYVEQTKPAEPVEKKEKILFNEPIPDASCVSYPKDNLRFPHIHPLLRSQELFYPC